MKFYYIDEPPKEDLLIDTIKIKSAHYYTVKMGLVQMQVCAHYNLIVLQK